MNLLDKMTFTSNKLIRTGALQQDNQLKNSNELKLGEPGKIELKRDGFYINDKPKLLRGGSFQWFKMPKEIWEDRIKKFKAMGYNTIDMYVSWRNHEPSEGQFDFNTFDIKHFLDLAKKHDMYVCFRPGPYICNEMDGGGLPAWLFAKSDKTDMDTKENNGKVNIRTNEKDYIDAVEKYLKKLNEEIKPYLITNGGPIILYTIENEYDWFLLTKKIEENSIYNGEKERTYNQDPDVKGYFEKLRDITLQSGINVPITSCPGTAHIAGLSDVKGVAPMPNMYTGLNVAEYSSQKIVKDMHSENHGGLYKDLPAGITETSREPNVLRRLILGGMNAVFQFNNLGYFQEDYQNTILINGMLVDNVRGALELAKSMFNKNYPSTGFFRPKIGFFPGKGDYYGCAISPSGVFRDNFYNLRRTNMFLDSYQELFANGSVSHRTSMDLGVKNQDRRVIVLNKEVGFKDPDNGRFNVNYWMPLKDNSALIGIFNNGKKDIISGKNTVEAFGEKFPKYTNLTVPVENGVNMSTKGIKTDKEYTMFVPFNFALSDNIRLKYSTSEILTNRNMNDEKVLVVYGKSGSEGELKIEASNFTMNSKTGGITINESSVSTFTISYKHGSPQGLSFTDESGKKTRIIILDTENAGKTWFSKNQDGDYMISGVEYLDNQDGKDILEFSSNSKRDDVFCFSKKPIEIPDLALDKYFNSETGFSSFKINRRIPDTLLNIDISSGKVMRDIDEIDPNHDTKNWISLGDKPQNLEKNKIYKGHAWYRADFELDEKTIKKDGGIFVEHAGDFSGIYINGKYINTLVPIGTAIDNKSRDKSYRFKIPAEVLLTGKNSISFKTEVWGHGGFLFPRGAIDSIPIPGIGPVKIPFLKIQIPGFGYDSTKGMEGTATFNNKPLTNWKLRADLGGKIKEYHKPNYNDEKWEDRKAPLNLKPGEVLWYRTNFNSKDFPNKDNWTLPLALELKGKNTKASIYLNGRLIGRWISDNDWLSRGGWFQPDKSMWTASSTDEFPIAIEALKQGNNVISIAFEDTSNATTNEIPGKIESISMKISTETKQENFVGLADQQVVYKRIPVKNRIPRKLPIPFVRSYSEIVPIRDEPLPREAIKNAFKR